MSGDIVDDLRAEADEMWYEETFCPELLRAAAEEIERLRGRIARLEGLP